MNRQPQTTSYEDLKSFTERILSGLGYDEEQARLTAWVLAEGDARGVTSHGVARLPFYLENLEGGFADPGAKPEIVCETPISVVLDGNGGIGPQIAARAMALAIDKARDGGAGFVSVRNSNHFGMASLWAQMASDEGLLGMVFCNTRRCSVPTFGKERILGTNPICVAIPSAGETDFILDMATTTVAHGKVEMYGRRGLEMPSGWAVNKRGEETEDARGFKNLFESDTRAGGHLFLGGVGEETSGHKGFGLGLMVELLTAGLSMGTWSGETFEEGSAGICQFFGAIRTDLFGDKTLIANHVESILDKVRSSPKAIGRDRIYIHGEKEREARERAIEEGILLDEATITMMNQMAKKARIDSIFS